MLFNPTPPTQPTEDGEPMPDLVMTYFGNKFRIRKHASYEGEWHARFQKLCVTYSVWLLQNGSLSTRIDRRLTLKAAKQLAKNYGYSHARQ